MSKITCPKCARVVAVRGSDAFARFASHNPLNKRPWNTRGRSPRCVASGMYTLPIRLARAERYHMEAKEKIDDAKRRSDEAAVKLASAQKDADDARAELERTANEIDRLRKMKANGGAK